jgi:hypothetical protein
MRFMLVKAGGVGHSRNKCLPKISALASTYLGNAPWHSKVHAMLYILVIYAYHKYEHGFLPCCAVL